MVAHEASEKSAAANVEVLVQRSVFLFSAAPTSVVSGRTLKAPLALRF
jgi:hypothetical protein